MAFAFDPRRSVIVLVAGDKSGGSEKRFYKELIKKADKLFTAHCEREKKEVKEIAMGKTLKERLNKLPAARRAKVDARAAELLAEEMSLKDLRKARELTQEHMAELLGIGQEGISRLEKRSDLLISTLRNYVARMGGRIELVVRFPDRPAVLLQDLAELSTAEPKSPAPKKSSNGLRRGQHTPEAGRIRQTSNLQWLFLVSRSDETHINDGACVYQLQLYHSKTPDSTAVSTHRPTHDYAEVAASSSAPA